MDTFHSMGKEQNNARLAHPFRLSGSNKLVNNTLGSVEKVAELRFPADQRIGVGHRITQFETEDAEFRQRAVADRVGRLVGI